MPRAASIALVTVLTVAIGAAGAAGAAHAVRPATHLASGLASPSPSFSPGPLPTEPPPSLPPQVTLPGNAQVVAPSTNVAWALVNYQALFASPDQGRSWEQRTLPTPPGGLRPVISFINYHEGWLLGPGVPATQCEEATADLWHTSDGAKTWQHLNASGIDKSQCKTGIWFADAKHGFIAAADPNHHPTIYRTVDSGITWASAALPDPPDFKSSGAGFVLYLIPWIKAFGSTLYLEAVGSQDVSDPSGRYYLFRSTDLGASWQWLTKVPPEPALVMVTETRWLALGGSGAQETVNAGQQWHPYTTDLNLDSPVLGGSQVVFADASVGYETGRALLQRTSDGGAHWVRIETPGTPPAEITPFPTPRLPEPNIAVLSAPSTDVVWALVANNELFRSTDRGETWTPRVLPVAAGSTEAPMPAFVDDMTGFVLLPSLPDNPACQQRAELWGTTDGAKTWHVVATAAAGQGPPLALPYTECKDAMHFADSKHGWLATGNAKSAVSIWRTTDGGATWQLGALNDPRLIAIGGVPLQASVLASYGSTVLAYVAPYVFRSTDGGASWAYAADVPSTLTSLGFVSATRWVELVPPDESIETTDAGSSWHTSTIDYTQPDPIPPPIVFADANVGYATEGSAVQRTLDGGMHWELIKTTWP